VLTAPLGLDPPLMLYLPRLCLRTFKRLFRLTPPCSDGCDERFSEVFFSRDSIVYYCFTHHGPVRDRERARWEHDVAAGETVSASASGARVGRRRHLGGWGSEYRAFMKEVERLVRSK
jgi:hypothetical protein